MWLVVQLIMTRLKLFLAVRNGFTYQELGLGLPDGTIPAWVIAEHQAISAMYNQAYEDKTPR